MFNPAAYKVRIKALKYTTYKYTRIPDSITCDLCQDNMVESMKSNSSLDVGKEIVDTFTQGLEASISTEERSPSTKECLTHLNPFDSSQDGSSDFDPFVSSDSYFSCLEGGNILEVFNELYEQQKRRQNIVLHNIPENDNPDKDIEIVNDIFKYILGEVPDMQINMKSMKPKMCRLGKKGYPKNRTIRCYLASQKDSVRLLKQCRVLKNLTKYKNVVLQADLTPLQYSHTKYLVKEKDIKNRQALRHNDKADWTIQNGKLCRKRDLYK